MRAFEIKFGIFTGVMFLLRLSECPVGGSSLKIAMILLSMFYAYFSFAYFNGIKLENSFNKESYKGISRLRIVGTVGFGFSISILIIALLYNVFNWPSKSILTLVGLICVLIVLVVGSWKFAKNHSKFYVKIFKRIVIFGVPALIFLLMPYLATDVKYRNNSESLEPVYEVVCVEDIESDTLKKE